LLLLFAGIARVCRVDLEFMRRLTLIAFSRQRSTF
jgi:hypothetical protein